MPRESVFEVERVSGLELYLSGSSGGGGVLKGEADDFVVDEVPGTDGDGDHTIFELEKVDWELNHLVRDLARELGVSRSRFGFAGMKDRSAVTRQRMSVWNVTAEEVRAADLEGVSFSNFRTGARVERGDLLGNRFRIRVRGGDEEAFAEVHAELEAAGGVPNLFGIQRFGGQRPITHRVGEEILLGDWEGAARIYLAEDWPFERRDAVEARRKLSGDWGDWREAFDYFPGRLRYERAVLHGLAEGMDFAEAFGELPENLLRLFVHAYQSYLFNVVVCERLREGLPLDRAVEGDVVCFADVDTGLPGRHVTERVRPQSEGKLNEMVEAGKAFVTAPLPGPDTKPATDDPGEVERGVLGDLEVDFEVDGRPRLSARGMRREALLGVMPELSGQVFEFFLPKGCYATTVLREYTKSDPLDMV
ncbi:MAG: putative tRNA pseudouridine synthase D [Methanonatronarchaeales archaeon]|nr:putative tRNA pseudouridine synthase D [Methanonatronarchaeales archaeon]